MTTHLDLAIDKHLDEAREAHEHDMKVQAIEVEVCELLKTIGDQMRKRGVTKLRFKWISITTKGPSKVYVQDDGEKHGEFYLTAHSAGIEDRSLVTLKTLGYCKAILTELLSEVVEDGDD